MTPFPPEPAAGRNAPPDPLKAARGGFTLVELLVAMSILVVMVAMMVIMTDETNRVWSSSRARIESFQAARDAFERITTTLSQATLNTYLDYYNGKDGTGESRSDAVAVNGVQTIFNAVSYGRASNLQFICGQASTLLPTNATRPTHAIFFQAPLGHVDNPTATSNDFKNLDRMLNAVGYYIEFSSDASLSPSFIPNPTASYRYRLMELNQPSQNLSIYFLPQRLNSATKPFYGVTTSWFANAIVPEQTADQTLSTGNTPVVIVADNVVALVVRPEASTQAAAAAAATQSGVTPADIAPAYGYDTKAYVPDNNPAVSGTLGALWQNQLPPLVQVTMVAIDAASATRLANANGSNPPVLCGSNLFTQTSDYNQDILTLENTLTGLHLNYRVFVSEISLRGAQWSQ